MSLFSKKIPSTETSLAGREDIMPVPEAHFVNNRPLKPPFPAHLKTALFGMGCFWGAERRFWEQPGIYTTAAGYAGGFTPNPTYEEVCSGRTGHSEVVLVVYDPAIITFEDLAALFWESHDPTQGMRQGNDIGSQYRSVIYVDDEALLKLARDSEQKFQSKLASAGHPSQITTEIGANQTFYYAEHYHQQYLAKVPDGYCGLGGTGVCYND